MTSGHLDKKRSAVSEVGIELWPTPGRWRRRDRSGETYWETKRYKIVGQKLAGSSKDDCGANVSFAISASILRGSKKKVLEGRFCDVTCPGLKGFFFFTVFTVNNLIRLQLTCYTELTPGFISLSTTYTCTVCDILSLQRRSEVTSTILRFSCG